MRNQRITDTDAAAVTGGTAPAGRPDLADVATALSEIRGAALWSLPQPSAELRERLERGVSHLPEENARTRTGGAARTSLRTRLGVAAVVVLGSAMALGGVTAAGAAGILPSGAQVVFDTVVERLTSDESRPPLDSVTEDPALAPATGEVPADDAPTGEPDAPTANPSEPSPAVPSPGSSESPSPGPSASPSAGAPDVAEDEVNDGKPKGDKPKDDKAKQDKSRDDKVRHDKHDTEETTSVVG